MSAYPNLFEVLDDNGDAVAQEIDRKSKVIIKEVPATKKKEAPKKEEKKLELKEKPTDGFETINRPPRQPRAEKPSPSVPQNSGRGGRGRGRDDRLPHTEGEHGTRRQDGEQHPRGDRPSRQGEERRPRAPRQEGDERPPRQEGDRRRPYQARQDGEQRTTRDNNGEENPRPYRERRDFDGPRDSNDESGERRSFEDRPRGRGRGGRGRGFYNNRANSENGHDLAEGAPLEADAQHYSDRAQRRPLREDRLSDDKGFVQAKQRAFDRRSATGRSGDDVKRSGRGPNNWGEVTEEANESETAYDRAVENDAAPAEAQADEVVKTQPEFVKDNKSEEDNTRTLKEYRQNLEKDLAQIELPKPRQAGEDSKDTWNNFKVLRKNDLNLKLSVVAPTKEKKKALESNKENAKTETAATTSKAKTRGSKVPVEKYFHIKVEPRQDRRRDREDKKVVESSSKQTKAAPSTIEKNSTEFPALTSVKN